ncbi:MAG: hypothetical protein IPG38_05245 [Chitinophagaceae bacterium]|nr:hypothetical protein [Chitinophagaceae bacterium]
MQKKYLAYILYLACILCVHVSCNDQKQKETTVPADISGHAAWSAQSNIYEVNLRQFSAAGTIMEFEKPCPG